MTCPYVQGDGTTKWCSLSEGQVREVERQRDELIETVRDVAGTLARWNEPGWAAIQLAAGTLDGACDRAARAD